MILGLVISFYAGALVGVILHAVIAMGRDEP